MQQIVNPIKAFVTYSFNYNRITVLHPTTVRVFSSSSPVDPLLLANFYNFVDLPEADTSSAVEAWKVLAVEYDLLGTILVSTEGYNAMLCGNPSSIHSFLSKFPLVGPQVPLPDDILFSDVDLSLTQPPFTKMKVYYKPEIVKLGMTLNNNTRHDLDISSNKDTYVKSEDFDDFAARDDEVEVGTFSTANFLPNMHKFSDLQTKESIRRIESILLDDFTFCDTLKKNENVESKKNEILESKKNEILESKKNEILESKKNEILKSKKNEILESKTNEILQSKKKNSTILTFCTGGIRCEKVVPFLKANGFKAKQLKGGILSYLQFKSKEDLKKAQNRTKNSYLSSNPDQKPRQNLDSVKEITTPSNHCHIDNVKVNTMVHTNPKVINLSQSNNCEKNVWNGECFVFDSRGAVLKDGSTPSPKHFSHQ